MNGKDLRLAVVLVLAACATVHERGEYGRPTKVSASEIRLYVGAAPVEAYGALLDALAAAEFRLASENAAEMTLETAWRDAEDIRGGGLWHTLFQGGPDGEVRLSARVVADSGGAWILARPQVRYRSTSSAGAPYEAPTPPLPRSRIDRWVWGLLENAARAAEVAARRAAASGAEPAPRSEPAPTTSETGAPPEEEEVGVVYYVLVEGKQYGPVSRETVERWRAENRIGDEAWIWRAGDPAWTRAGDFFAP